jgi:acyl-CoA synthetase (AMP-forming)/AMP-acid ligase II/thioesterase domain-containing protein
MRTLKVIYPVTAPSIRSQGVADGTIGREIQRRAKLQPDHPAMVSKGLAPLSYRELELLIGEVRAALRLAGFGRSARIAIAMPNSPQAALAILAVACSAVSIPLNPRLLLSEIESSLSALRPDAVLLLKGSDSDARRAAENKGIMIIEAAQPKDGALGLMIIEPRPSTAAASDEPDEPDPAAPAFILQTSGTTAEPKLIPYSHRNMLAVAARCQAWFNLTPEDRCLSVSPVFYAHGLKVTVLTPLLTGGTAAFPADASKFDYAEWFGALKPTWYSAGPTLHRLVFDQTQSIADAKKGHSLRFILSSGAPLPRNVLEGLQHTLGVPLVEHYSSSEASLIAANLPPPGGSKPGTVGVPWPDTVIIVGDDDRRLLPREQGEILVSGPTVISGYLDAPDLNCRSFCNGWFKTGDIGSLDEDGFLTLHGRKIDVINRGGEKISPIEIDEVLARHPAVAEAAAFSVPHPRLGEDVAAAVVLRSGVTVTPVELRRYLQEEVASFKVPRRIVIRDHLPKGKTGKILRRQLTESLEETAASETQVEAGSLLEDSPIDLGLAIQLTELWERLLNTAPLSLDDDFLEKGGDSLLAIEMLAEVEKLIGDTIPSSILLEASTIRQLAHVLSESGNLKPKSLVQMHPNGGQTPLIFFHNDYIGGGYYTLKLASLLGANQPLLTVAPHGIDDEPIPHSIEAMAFDRYPLIVNAQPEGPYRLCGVCASGLVAFEVARLLIAAGKEVEMVGMIDTPTINARRSLQLFFSLMNRARPMAGTVVEHTIRSTFRIFSFFDKFWNLPATRRWDFVKDNARKLVASGSNLVRAAPTIAGQPATNNPHKSSGGISPVGLPNDELNSRYGIVVSNYLPKPLAVRVIYFSIEYGLGAWGRIGSDLEVIKLPGTHNGFDLADVANHLRARLQTSLSRKSETSVGASPTFLQVSEQLFLREPNSS